MGFPDFLKDFSRFSTRNANLLKSQKGFAGTQLPHSTGKNETGEHHIEYQGPTSLFQKRHMIHSQ